MPTATLTSVFFNLVDFTEDTSSPPLSQISPTYPPFQNNTLFNSTLGKMVEKLEIVKMIGENTKNVSLQFSPR
jgi:hypothetical protein